MLCVLPQYIETQQLVMAAIANWYKKSDSPGEQSQKLSKIVDIAHDLKVNHFILHTTHITCMLTHTHPHAVFGKYENSYSLKCVHILVVFAYTDTAYVYKMMFYSFLLSSV